MRKVDEGLIKTSSKTSGGHRLYIEYAPKTDFSIKIYGIGSSSEQFKGNLENPTSSWRESIQQQLELVKRE